MTTSLTYVDEKVIIIFDHLETDCRENRVSLMASMWVAQSSWFTGDKQGILTLFFCVVKPLYGQLFNWNCCVDIGSEGKIWKSIQNSIFHWKNEDKSFMEVKYTIFLTVGIFRPFSSPSGKNVLIKNMVHTFFFKKITKICCIFGKNARNKCFRSKYQQLSANFGQIFAFPTPKH